MAPMKTAEWKEAASTQAVNRGHTVTMIKVPNVSFQRWLASGSPTISPKQHISVLPTPPESPTTPTRPLPNEGVVPTYEVISPTVATPSVVSAKVQEVPHRWMRPFKVDWMLRAIHEGRNDNAAHAALAVWIHKDKGNEMTDELMTEL